MLQIKIIDSYQLQTYERVMEYVNQFCASHDVVEVKHDVKKDDVIYSIVYRAPQDTTERDRTSGVGAEAPLCIPTPRSQIAVSDDPQPAQAQTASNTSQLAIAARAVVQYWKSYDDPGTFFKLIEDLDNALQQQA